MQIRLKFHKKHVFKLKIDFLSLDLNKTCQKYYKCRLKRSFWGLKEKNFKKKIYFLAKNMYRHLLFPNIHHT